jgi:hypothetical protein
MDDVTADFKAYANRVLRNKKTEERWDLAEWTRLKDNPRLYRDLDCTPEADQLVDRCREVCAEQDWELKFLSAVPRGNDMPWAFYDKVNWAAKYFPDIPVMFGPYSHDKYTHCRPGDILIDDRTSNMTEWRAVGGIGIQHRGDIELTLAELAKIVENYPK